MSVTLAYSREHACHNKPMIWQPAGRHFYCAVCNRKEGPNSYALVIEPKDQARRSERLADARLESIFATSSLFDSPPEV